VDLFEMPCHRRQGLGAGGREVRHAAPADVAGRPGTKHGGHDLGLGPDVGDRPPQALDAGAVGERRLAHGEHDEIGDEHAIRSQVPHYVVGRLAGSGHAGHGVGAHRRDHGAASFPDDHRSRQALDEADGVAHVRGDRGAAHAATAAPAADHGDAGQDRVFVAVRGGVQAAARGAEELGCAEERGCAELLGASHDLGFGRPSASHRHHDHRRGAATAHGQAAGQVAADGGLADPLAGTDDGKRWFAGETLKRLGEELEVGSDVTRAPCERHADELEPRAVA
jgi:hypothetical protein